MKTGKDYLIEELKAQLREKKEECDRITKERDEYLYHLDEIRKSFSYRLGLSLTAWYRKLRK